MASDPDPVSDAERVGGYIHSPHDAQRVTFNVKDCLLSLIISRSKRHNDMWIYPPDTNYFTFQFIDDSNVECGRETMMSRDENWHKTKENACSQF